jgi:hypothetical protein
MLSFALSPPALPQKKLAACQSSLFLKSFFSTPVSHSEALTIEAHYLFIQREKVVTSVFPVL